MYRRVRTLPRKSTYDTAKEKWKLYNITVDVPDIRNFDGDAG
ncbi:MAG: hypothetical protein A4E64_00392 [Syntrophorhabdus sp. PtaU1.Bin058]|nr:MAG: hypothetical protein A4E64_00392 [Syntrophorhabdus sp. PtaU1.Bin058]